MLITMQPVQCIIQNYLTAKKFLWLFKISNGFNHFQPDSCHTPLSTQNNINNYASHSLEIIFCKRLGYIKILKSYGIKTSGQKILPCCGLIIKSSSWNTVWSWCRHTARYTGNAAAPQYTWQKTEAVRLWGPASVWPSSVSLACRLTPLLASLQACNITSILLTQAAAI